MGKRIRRRRRDGYVQVYLPQHPMSMASGWIYEHRFKMARSLGRNLARTEVVHHINHVRDDNRIRNLRLYSSQGAHIAGHRASGACLHCGRSTPAIRLHSIDPPECHSCYQREYLRRKLNRGPRRATKATCVACGLRNEKIHKRDPPTCHRCYMRLRMRAIRSAAAGS